MSSLVRYDGMYVARQALAKRRVPKPSTAPTAATPATPKPSHEAHQSEDASSRSHGSGPSPRASDLDAAASGAKRAEIARSQQALERAIRSVAVTSKRNPEALSDIRAEAEKRAAEHFASHDIYVDHDGTAYAASYADGEIHLSRSSEKGGSLAGRPAATEIAITQSISGSRTTEVKMRTAPASAAQPQHTSVLRVSSSRDGAITSVDTTQNVRTTARSMTFKQHTDLNAHGHITRMQTETSINEPRHSRFESSVQEYRSDGSLKIDTTTVHDHRDAVDGTRHSKPQPATDSHAVTVTNFGHDGRAASSHAVTTTTAGDSSRKETRDVAYRGGAPTKIRTETSTQSTSLGDGGTTSVTSAHQVTELEAGGAPLTFDSSTGAPTNATIRGTLDTSTTLIDGKDSTQRQIFEQHATISGADVAWKRLRVTSQDLNTDGSIYTQEAIDYGSDKLDGSGMPRIDGDGTTVEGTKVDELHVDHRSWWNRNKHMVSTALSIGGGLLMLTGVGSAVGGAMMVAGGAIALSDDLPEFIDHPSWQGALAVGLDGVGMVAGGAGVMSKFARGAVVVTDITAGTDAVMAVRGSAVLAEGVTDLNMAARGFSAADVILDNGLVKAVGAYALGNQAWQTGSRIWHDGIDSLSAEDWIGAIGTAVTVGAARAINRRGTPTADVPQRSGSGSVTSPTPRPEYIIPKDSIAEFVLPEKKIQHSFRHAPDFDVPVRRGADGKVLSPNRAEQAAFESALRGHIGSPDTVALRGTFKPRSGSSTPQQATIYVEPATRNMVAVGADGTMLAAYRLNPSQAEHLYGHGSVGYTPIKSIEAQRALKMEAAASAGAGGSGAPQSRAGDAIRAVRDNASRGWDAFTTRPAIFTAVEGVRSLAARVGKAVDEPALAREHAAAGDVTYSSPRRELGKRDAQITDINQGQLGDCYLHAAVGAYALKDPDAVAALVRRKRGGIEVRLESGERVKMSRMLPTRNGELIYGAHGSNAPLWSAYVEKAYAMKRGGYEAIGNGGWPSDVHAFLTGSVTEVTFQSKGTHRPYGDLISEAGSGARMTVAIKPTSGYGAASSEGAAIIADRGLYGNHAYTVSRVFTDADGVRMVELVNPWGFRHPKPVALDALDSIASGVTIDSQLIRRPYQ